MDKIVRIKNALVAEILTDSITTIEEAAYWYNPEFASECVQAPDEVQQGWAYINGQFYAPGPTLDELRANKISELSAATEASIYAGVDVTTSFGTGHYSLTAHDQTNLLLILARINAGAEGYIYHADGEDRIYYPAADLLLIINATAHFITYSNTYFSKLRDWANRETDMQAIYYGATLPEDLQAEFDALIASI